MHFLILTTTTLADAFFMPLIYLAMILFKLQQMRK
uniref:Uncharacterized protein n=1 Tax=Timema genevievae TaxID=629358 RepID=A0A7R9K953_TIMGE|nr:unnamed protein product [Timema genevievae]